MKNETESLRQAKGGSAWQQTSNFGGGTYQQVGFGGYSYNAGWSARTQWCRPGGGAGFGLRLPGFGFNLGIGFGF